MSSTSADGMVLQISASEQKLAESIVDTDKSKKSEVKKISNAHDSDSGLEPTSSSSASNCSEDDQGEDDNQIDCFEDASDNLHNNSVSDSQQNGQHSVSSNGAKQQQTVTRKPSKGKDADRSSLKVRLDEIRELLRLALSNEFIKALEQCEERAKSELYASLAHGVLSFLRAALTLEQADLQAALASITNSYELSQQKRRQVSTASMVMRFLYKPNYNTYTDDEIHAELVNAEATLMLSLVSFLSDQSVLCLVRGAFRIRACHQRYKECRYILEHRDNWSSDTAKLHFESGVRMGDGIFNLLMSYLPRRVLKFLEYVGFSGSRSVGVGELEKSIALGDGLRSVFSALVILTYHSYVENLFGLGDYDANKVEQLNATFLGHYPNSAFFLLFTGRYNQMQGKMDEAIACFTKCCQVQMDWKQFHSICHWEMMWCYVCQMNWTQAAHYADLLRQHSKWSPASYQYQYGTFLYAKLVQEQRQGAIDEHSDEFKVRMGEIRAIIDKVPSLRIRYAGKTLPGDKFAITRAMRFGERNNRLALPAIEFLYVWNIFCTLKNSPQLVQALMATIDEEIALINKSIEQEQEVGASGEISEPHNSNDNDTTTDADNDCDDLDDSKKSQSGANLWIDDLCLMYLLKGLCLKYLNRYEEAESIFMKIIDYEHQIVEDKFLVPHSAMELAILNLDMKQYSSAKSWIKLARHSYSGYLMETIVHFRLHAASRLIRIEELQEQKHLESQQEEEDWERSCSQSPCPSPAVNHRSADVV